MTCSKKRFSGTNRLPLLLWMDHLWYSETKVDREWFLDRAVITWDIENIERSEWMASVSCSHSWWGPTFEGLFKDEPPMFIVQKFIDILSRLALYEAVSERHGFCALTEGHSYTSSRAVFLREKGDRELWLSKTRTAKGTYKKNKQNGRRNRWGKRMTEIKSFNRWRLSQRAPVS